MFRKFTRRILRAMLRRWPYMFLISLISMTLMTLTYLRFVTTRTENPKLNVFLPHEVKQPSAKEIIVNKTNIQNGKQETNEVPQEKVTEEDFHNQENITFPHMYINDEGKGQNGTAVIIKKSNLGPKNQNLFDEGYKLHSFNNYVSDLISVDRQPPRARDPLCLTQTYPDDLPDTSVIITFLNEAWSVLVRTVHSVINTSPPHLLREIILVDDFSDYDYLKAPLEVYMKRFPKVKIIHNKKREGLIRSRLNGAIIATGKVLTFLDSHIECVTGWLQPLLTRIKENSSNVVWPSIPTIDQDTFRFIPFPSAKSLPLGIFDWRLTFIWGPAGLSERETPISPIKSPTMAGGLFSIDREYFYKIGSYDDQMWLWGAENLEISFRIWMCGGTLEIIPCSVIGHVFRRRNVNINSKNIQALTYNTVRTAMVWLDDYKYLYSKHNNVNLTDYGDITSRLELRRNLNCKSFQWYLDNVFKTLFIPQKAVKTGLLQSVAKPFNCLRAPDAKDGHVSIAKCDRKNFPEQVFYTTNIGELRLLIHCIDVGKPTLSMLPCHMMKGNQEFHFKEDRTIFSPSKNKCLEWNLLTTVIEAKECNGNVFQQWTWEELPLDYFKTV